MKLDYEVRNWIHKYYKDIQMLPTLFQKKVYSRSSSHFINSDVELDVDENLF